jgi:hypothetical protein
VSAVPPFESSSPIDTTGGVNPAMSSLDSATQADTAYATADLPEASAGYKDVQGREVANLSDQFSQPPPQPQRNPLGRLFPLLAIAAFGGKSSKLDAGNMLAATTGVVKGYLAGNAEAFQTAETQYQEAYKRFKDRQEQQDKIFKEMREAYKGRIDADVKALQFARQLTHDEAVAAHQTAAMAQQYQEYTAKLDEQSKKDDALRLHQQIVEKALLENAKSNRIRADAASENADTRKNNPPGSAVAKKKTAEAKSLAASTIPIIDETIKLIESPGRLPTTGVGGFARSVKENVTGSLDKSSDQTAHKVNSNLTTLTAAATHMAGLRPGVGAMKEFANTLGSQGFGSNDAATLANLRALKQRLLETANTPDTTGSTQDGPDKPVGTLWRVPDSNGDVHQLRSLGNGKWETIQ